MRRFIAATVVAATAVVGGGVAMAVTSGNSPTAVTNAADEATTTAPSTTVTDSTVPGSSTPDTKAPATSAPSTVPGTPTPPDDQAAPDGARHDRFKAFLDGLVAKGTITQAQADAIATEWKAAMPRRDEGGRRGRPGFGFGMDILRQGEDTVAKTLGISTDDLRTALRNGQSIADIAKAHNVDPAAVTKALTDLANGQIDKAVTDGKLTAEQAQKMRDRLGEMIAGMVNNSGRPRGGDHHAPPTTTN